MTRANGCVWLIPGSNRWGARRRDLVIWLVNRSGRLRRILLAWLFKAMEVRRGQLFLMHGYTVHVALPNKTRETRLALVLRHCRPSVVARNHDRERRVAANRTHSPLVDDNQEDLIPCLIAQGEDRHKVNVIREKPLVDLA